LTGTQKKEETPMKTARTLSLALLFLCGVWALAAGPLFAARAYPSRSQQGSGPDLAPAVPVPTVAATPVSKPHSVKSSSIASALIFDYHIPVQQVVRDEISAHVGYVWGASAPRQSGDSIRHDYYVQWAHGWCPPFGLVEKCPKGGPPSFPWLKKHHPNWILWQADTQGVPTKPARSKYDPGPILDFTNPAVQQYWMDHYIASHLKQGFDGIAWDDPTVYDPYGAVGHFDTHHRFIRQYDGSLQDPGWANAQVRALADFLGRAQAIDPKVQFALATPVDCLYAPMASWLLPLSYVDTIVDEEGYTYWGNKEPWITSSPGTYCNNRWLEKTNFYIQMQKAGKHLVLINAVPLRVHAYMTDTNPTARAYLQWALANYLLVKYSHTYFWFGSGQHYGYPIVKQREEMADLGAATGDMHTFQGIYVRWFTKGMALVNPSPTTPFTVTLLRSGRYEDLYGQNVNRVTMPPHSGLVLVRRH
jgi:Hypothetical glycosyl hydrolase family 15